MHVLDDEHERTATAAAQPHLAQRVERARGQDLAAQRAHGLIGLLEVRAGDKQERGALDRGRSPASAAWRGPSRRRAQGVGPGDAADAAQQVQDRQVGDRAPVRETAALEPRGLLADVARTSGADATCPPRLADHSRHAAVTLGDLADELAQGGRLASRPTKRLRTRLPRAAPAPTAADR